MTCRQGTRPLLLRGMERLDLAMGGLSVAWAAGLRWRLCGQGKSDCGAPAKMRKRIALKYCGGCDPGYDRVEYFRKIQNAADGKIEWVSVDEGDFEAVLVICGCDTACAAEKMAPANCGSRRLILVRDDKRDPAKIVESLLSEVKL